MEELARLEGEVHALWDGLDTIVSQPRGNNRGDGQARWLNTHPQHLKGLEITPLG